jgi:hypothetical protein
LGFSVPADPEYAIGWLVHFGPQPIVFYSCVQWPEEYTRLSNAVFMAPDTEKLRSATREMITYVSQEAMLTPIVALGSTYVVAPYVHTDRLEQHMMVWLAFDDWMDPH